MTIDKLKDMELIGINEIVGEETGECDLCSKHDELYHDSKKDLFVCWECLNMEDCSSYC